MLALIFVALGGAVGALMRYGSTLAIYRLSGQPLPWGTLFVNVAGSFALGVLMAAVERGSVSDSTRMFVSVGLLGAFTTFSAFSWETAFMLRNGEWLRALAYAGTSVVVCVAALLAGAALATR